MSAAVTVPNTLPAVIVALPAEVLEQAGRLVALADATLAGDVSAVTVASFEQANDLFRQINALRKGISKQRLELTRPIDTLKDDIIEAERSATVPLTEAEGRLAAKISAANRELLRRRQEEERLAREAAEVAAKAERERIAAEQAERQRLADEKAAEEKALFGDDCEPEAKPVQVVPEIVPEVIRPTTTAAAPLPKAAVREQVRKKLVIHDAEALIAEACKNGGKIAGRLVLAIDEKAVEALAKAGVPVVGARLDEVVTVGSAGRR